MHVEDRRWRRWVAVVVVAAPVVVAAGSLLGRHWYASSDQALISLRIDDVGTAHTPLVGPGSRLGWAHPGPILFWLLAPFRAVFGPTGVLAGVATVNLVAVVGVVLVGWRRGGARTAGLLALAVATLLHTLGLTALVDPWNPTAAFLPFLLVLVLVWAVVAGDLPMLPLAVVAGSWSVQSHVGYLPVVGGLLVLAAVATAVEGRRRPGSRAGRWGAIAAGAALVLWVPPLVEQITGDPGNLGLLADYIRDPDGPPRGWADALGVAGVQLHPVGAWITGEDITDDGLARTGPVVPAVLVVTAVAVATWWAWRRRDRPVAAFGIVTLAGAVLATVATARVTGLFVPYILRWWWAVAALAAVTVVHAVLDAVAPEEEQTGQLTTGVALAGAAALAVALVAQAPAPLPFETISEAIAELRQPVAAGLDPEATYLVRGVDSTTFGASTHGLFLELERLGFDVRSDRFDTAELAYGERRLADPDEVDGIITIVSGRGRGSGFAPPAGAELLARSGPARDGFLVYLADAPSP